MAMYSDNLTMDVKIRQLGSRQQFAPREAAGEISSKIHERHRYDKRVEREPCEMDCDYLYHPDTGTYRRAHLASTFATTAQLKVFDTSAEGSGEL